MANQISNHFALTALQEGVTVQGSLRVAGSLSQNYNANTQKCIPDWKATASARPIIYPVIRRGVTYLSAASIVGAQWLYNDAVIEFGDDKKSTNFLDADGDPIFEVGTMAVTLGGTSVQVPRITIISNLASATNIDLDTIGYQGSVEVQGKQAAFQCQVDVKIAQMTAQGYLGLLTPESAIISTKGEMVRIDASLYGEDGTAVSVFYTKWYNAGTGSELAGTTDAKSVTINEADVTDNLVFRCDFFLDAAHTNRVTTAFASIDDTQDPEYLYISLNGSNADYSGQLSPGDSCDVKAWVATMEDATAINTAYTSFSVKFYDGDQNEITGTQPIMSTSNNQGTVTIPYDFVASNGYKIFGIVSAS